MRHVLSAPLVPTLLLCVGLFWAGTDAGAQEARLKQPAAVIELFTSGGCASCPPADQLFAKQADRDDVLALAWHVDYWDYLGWRDPFGDPRFSARQRGYSKALGEGVYTPQVVVNGTAQAVGHREHEIARLVENAGAPFVPLQVARDGEGLRVSLGGGPARRRAAEGAMLILVWYDHGHELPIDEGENAGRSIMYRNVVREMQMLGSVRDGALQVNLPFDVLARPEGGEALALLLQKMDEGRPGPIVGAAVIGDVPRG